jgi:beta-lactamase class A
VEAPAQRLIVGAEPFVPARPLQNEAVVRIEPPAAEPAGTPGEESARVSPAASEQLQWLMRALSGELSPREQRRIDRRFAPEFLRRVPAEQIRTVLRHWRRDELAGGGVRLHALSEGEAPGSLLAILEATDAGTYTQVRLGVDEQGRIASLWLAPAVDIDPGQIDSWERLIARVLELPGESSLTVAEVFHQRLELGAIAAANAEASLAIGSTFKLYILGALAELIAEGGAAWDEPLEIREELKSLPTGQMQLEQEGAAFAIERYAELMISISDNTAADHLLHRVGRERVEAYMARHGNRDPRNTPLLSTMDLFRLKLGPDRELAQRFAQASAEQQRAMLTPGGVVEQTIPSFAGALMWRAPYEIDTIEWFASTSELGAVMAELDRLSRRPGLEPLGRILRINPGLAFDPQMWPAVAYKGGSEPGVINMTWLLTRADQRMFVISITWNNGAAPVDLRRLAQLAGAGVSFLARDLRPEAAR